MGSEDFLTLMVAQLENQDPTKPLDNMQFMGQLAQFGTVSGIQELNEAFGGLSAALGSNQALQAASLVGRDVVTVRMSVSCRSTRRADGEAVLALDATVAFDSATSAGSFYVQDMAGASSTAPRCRRVTAANSRCNGTAAMRRGTCWSPDATACPPRLSSMDRAPPSRFTHTSVSPRSPWSRRPVLSR
jgi:hypothetical protein